MAIDPDLFMAILSMDAYNRGYSAGIGSATDGLGSASDGTVRIGDATIIKNLADAGLAAAAQAAGFYAVAYQWNNQTVISYRGTDNLFQLANLNPWSDAPGGEIWASVSADVDKRIREQIGAGVFPIRLKPEDWSSGDTVWLLDVIAPTEKLATDVLKGFRHVAKKDEVNIHPLVTKLVNAEELKKLSRAANDTRTASDNQPVH